MNLVDLLLIVIILFAAWSGYRKGFVLATINLVVWAGSIVAGFLLYKYIAAFLTRFFPVLGVWTSPLAFFVTILIARILLSLLLTPVLTTTPEQAHRHEVNRILGVVPGVANGLINATLVALLLLAMPFFESLKTATRDSVGVNKLTPAAEWVEDKLGPVFDEAISNTLTKLTVEPGSKETVQLGYTINNTKVRADLEAQMLNLINKERTQRGLQPLQADEEMRAVARAHSRDMFARGYFSHYTPDGKDPFDRMKAAHVRFRTAGENLALAQTLSIAHHGLMNSPGHRANILNPAFGRVGIGIVQGGIYGLMISQEFRN